jgi:hypothetical protein
MRPGKGADERRSHTGHRLGIERWIAGLTSNTVCSE